MTELSLNAQLGARVKSIQQAWGHDSPSETLAIIYDAVIHRWMIPQPPVQEENKSAFRVRLRSRHVNYFTQISLQTGCGVSELARSFLIQWICGAGTTQIATSQPRQLPPAPQPKPLTTRKPTKATQERVQSTLIATAPIQEPVKRPTGRDLLRGLKK